MTLLRRSQTLVDLTAYTFDRVFVDYLADAALRGVRVKILLDEDQAVPEEHLSQFGDDDFSLVQSHACLPAGADVDGCSQNQFAKSCLHCQGS